jgi:pimeloyl-ACP methyl ester carboxylesterase
MASSAQRLPVDPGDYGAAGRSAWLDVDWREHQRWVTVAGRPLNVIELGSGPPVVFIHGLSGSWQNWLEQLPVFARDHRVVALDLPGFGASPMPEERISIPGYGRLVVALLDELGIDHAAIVGNSMGGFIGAEMAIAAPSRVERLTLVSAAGLSIADLRNESALAVLRKLDRRLAAYAGWLGTRSSAITSRRRARQMVFRLVAHRPELLSGALVSEQVRGSGKPGFVAALDALTDYPIRDRLGEIGCPVLIVWGARDLLVPVRDADVFERLIPNSRKVVWPDTGHMAMLERPAAFNALLEAFLEEEPGERLGAPAEGAEDAPSPATPAAPAAERARPRAVEPAAGKAAAPRAKRARPAPAKAAPAKDDASPAKPRATRARPAAATAKDDTPSPPAATRARPATAKDDAPSPPAATRARPVGAKDDAPSPPAATRDRPATAKDDAPSPPAATRARPATAKDGADDAPPAAKRSRTSPAAKPARAARPKTERPAADSRNGAKPSPPDDAGRGRARRKADAADAPDEAPANRPARRARKTG